MKPFFVAPVVALGLLATACDKQKPSPRADVWGDDSTEVIVSDNLVKVPFTRTPSGLIELQVSLNGVPFNMWWDTGASATCISVMELQRLAKEGKISMDDYMGPALSTIADGSTTESAVFRIKEIYIQGKDNKYLRLTDIEAMVSPNMEAPLLLGQNVMQELPKHLVNDDEGVIEFGNR